jgi:hypothetical protein
MIGENMLVRLLEDFNDGSLLRLKGDVFDVDPNQAAWMIENRKAEVVEIKEQDDPEGAKVIEKKTAKHGKK